MIEQKLSARLTAWTAAMLVAGCGSDSALAPEDASPVSTTAVQVRDNSFMPSNILVDVGATVTWTWEGGNLHNVTWVSVDLAVSDTQSSGAHAVMIPVDATGVLAYYCSIHGTPTSGMRGVIQVRP